MTTINLLPWREIKREREKKEFTMLLLMALILGSAIAFAMYYYASDLVSGQKHRNQLLQDEINTFNGQIAEIKQLKDLRARLISRMTVVQNLQATRSLTVHLLDELIKILPDGVYLTQMKREGNRITLLGYSESNSNVSILMRNIEQNPWIQNPELTEIKKSKDALDPNDTNAPTPETGENEFKLSFILKPKNSALLTL
ncbi:PilN domain-containing protein [Legionella sp. 16cNR16C]|uniref:PilN domain-containing protein n=1 Tax=Legionella sp. 16cNR16C TaxID=2905656 RepID=UPI001E550A2E|nr:PilN domain-containing protein [Legionella sp. 16cNR16C]MCE3046171.1 PilN domain-containing protein [Legionella sp. 16cNR16C]